MAPVMLPAAFEFLSVTSSPVDAYATYAPPMNFPPRTNSDATGHECWFVAGFDALRIRNVTVSLFVTLNSVSAASENDVPSKYSRRTSYVPVCVTAIMKSADAFPNVCTMAPIAVKLYHDEAEELSGAVTVTR